MSLFDTRTTNNRCGDPSHIAGNVCRAFSSTDEGTHPWANVEWVGDVATCTFHPTQQDALDDVNGIGETMIAADGSIS
jgi:hypothetical protein